MTLWTYNPNIPAANNRPSADQGPMQNNFLNIGNLINVDHIGFNLANGGLHRQVNMFNQGSPAVQGDLVLYARTSAGQSSLWVKNNTGIDLPFSTGAPNGAANGNTSMFGGLIFQWGSGTVATSGSPTAFTFPIVFPTSVFSVTFGSEYTITTDSPSANPIFIKKNTITLSGFSMINSSSGTPTKVYWMAIGK